MIADAAQSEGVADGFRKRLSEHTDPLYQHVEDAKADLKHRHSSGSGWFGLAVIVILLLIIIVIAD